MSWLRYLTLASFRRWNPQWQMRLYSAPCLHRATWTSGEASNDGASPFDYRDRLKELDIELCEYVPSFRQLPPAHSSDLFQWEMLASDGGFYADMDILWVASLDRIVSLCRHADVMLCNQAESFSIGFCGASRQSAVYATIREEAQNAYCADNYQTAGECAVYRAFGVSGIDRRVERTVAAMRQRFPDYSIRELATETVYPFSWREVAEIFESLHAIPEAALGLHWFGGNPIAQKWNAKLTEDAWRQYRTTMTDAIARVVDG